jgi:HEAT repeat protein
MRYIVWVLSPVILFNACVIGAWAQSAASAPPTSAVIDALIRGLHSADAEVRAHAAKSLAELLEGAAPASKALVAALGDPDQKVREAARNALVEIGPPAIPYLIGAIKRGSPAKRRRMRRPQADRRTAAGARTECTHRRLTALNTRKRLLALETCCIIGWGPPRPRDTFKDLLPVLMKCLNERDARIRVAAVRSLTAIREPSSVPRLIRLLERDKDVKVRYEVLQAFIALEEKADAAVPLLARMVVRDYDTIYEGLASLGEEAAEALGLMREPAVPALASIIADMKLKSAIRRTALTALGKLAMEGHAKIAATGPVLCQALADRDERVRFSAALTLSKMESADGGVRAALLVATADKSPLVRMQAAVAIHHFDRQDPIVLATIMPFLDDKDAKIRQSACFTLNEIGAPDANPAIPKLINMMSDADSGVRLDAIYALDTMGGQKADIRAAIPGLTIVAEKDPNATVRDAARQCLKWAKR